MNSIMLLDELNLCFTNLYTWEKQHMFAVPGVIPSEMIIIKTRYPLEVTT